MILYLCAERGLGAGGRQESRLPSGAELPGAMGGEDR